MKVTHSYWLGLGSGLILSALLTLIFSPQPGLSDVQSIDNPQVTSPFNSPVQSSEATQSSEVDQPSEVAQPQDLPSEVQGAGQVDWDFIIPKGASSEQIADLLLAQDFIKDKAAFLELAQQMGAEKRLGSGTFKLCLGLTEEEVIRRLLK